MQKEEKFSNWFDKARKGEKGYDMMYRCKDTYIITSERDMEMITTLVLFVWEDKKLKFHYSWTVGQELEEKENVIFIIKKDKKLMLCLDNKEIYSFENKKENAGNEKVMIYWKSDFVSTLVFASNQAKEVESVVSINSRDNEISAIEIVVNQIAKGLLDKQCERRKNNENQC